MTQSATRHASEKDRSGVVTRPWPAWTLAAVALLVAANAIFGGWRLIADGFGLPAEWLSQMPVDTWAWPGVALILGVAVPQVATAGAIATVSGRRPAVGYWLGLAAGAALVLWIVGQLALLQHYFFLQPVVACLGVIEMALALSWRHLVGRTGSRHPAPPGTG